MSRRTLRRAGAAGAALLVGTLAGVILFTNPEASLLLKAVYVAVIIWYWLISESAADRGLDLRACLMAEI
jgi:hypothetical protein